MELFNYKLNCRICLKAHNASKNVFSYIVEGCQEPLARIIFSLFKIELHSHNAYPQFICRKCLTEVENILLFKEDLVRNQEFLLGLFKVAYPNHVEKKTCDSSKIFPPSCSFVSYSTDLSDSGHSQLPEGFTIPSVTQVKLNSNISDENQLAVKNKIAQTTQLESTIEPSLQLACTDCNKSFKCSRALQNHYSKAHCQEKTEKEIIHAKRTLRSPCKQKIKNQLLKTDENKNVPFEHLPPQEIEFRQTVINENKPNIDIARISRNVSTDGVCPVELVIPQASFLQNFNLITLHDAAILKTRQAPLNRNRQRLFSKKSKTVKKVARNVSRSIDIIRKRSRVEPPASKKIGRNENILNEVTKRSANFQSRYGYRNYNSTFLRRGRVIRKTDTIFNICQRKTNRNKTAGKPAKRTQSTLGPSSLSEIECNQNGCENYLSNNERKQDILSPSELKLEGTEQKEDTNDVSVFKKSRKVIIDKEVKKPDLLITAMEVPSPTSRSSKYNKPTPSDTKSEVPSPSSSRSSKLYDSIPSKYFFTSSGKEISLDDKETLRTQMQSNFLSHDDSSAGNQNVKSYNTHLQHDIQNGSFFKRNEPDSKITLFHKSGPVGETDTDVWSIGDYQSETGFQKKLQVQLERFPSSRSLDGRSRNYKSPNKLESSPSSSIIEKQKPIYKLTRLQLKNEGSFATISSLSPLECAEVSPVLKKGRGRSRRFESGGSTELFDSTKTEEDQKYNLRRKMPSANNNNNCLSLNDKTPNYKTNTLKGISRANRNAIKQKRCSRTDRGLEAFQQSPEVTLMDQTTNSNILATQVKSLHNSEGDPILNRLSPEWLPNTSARNVKTEVVSTLQTLSDRYEIDNNIGLRMKLRKTVSSDSINSLKYETQDTEENNDGLQEPSVVPILSDNNAGKEHLFRKQFSDRVWNVNVNDNQEFHLTLIHTDLTSNAVPEDMDNAELSEYPKNGRRNRSSFSSNKTLEYQEDKCKLELKNTISIGSDECSKNLELSSDSLDLPAQPKRRGRPPVKVSPSVCKTTRPKRLGNIHAKTFDNERDDICKRKPKRDRSSSQTSSTSKIESPIRHNRLGKSRGFTDGIERKPEN